MDTLAISARVSLLGIVAFLLVTFVGSACGGPAVVPSPLVTPTWPVVTPSATVTELLEAQSMTEIPEEDEPCSDGRARFSNAMTWVPSTGYDENVEGTCVCYRAAAVCEPEYPSFPDYTWVPYETHRMPGNVCFCWVL